MSAGSMAGGAMYEVAAGLPFFVSGALNVLSIALVFLFYRLVRTRAAPAGMA